MRNIVMLLGLSLMAAADLIGGQTEAALSAEAPLQPNLDPRVLAVHPPAHYSRFIVPVSIHVACLNEHTCAERPGVRYTPAYLGRMVATASHWYSPPLDGVFRDDYRGIQFVLAHVDRVISEKLYYWNDKDEHDPIIKQLIDRRPASFVGYFNYFITGSPLCGVTGIGQLMKDVPRSFIGPGCFGDDDPENGFFGSAVLAHETMHAIGMGHITTENPKDHTEEEAECGMRFRYPQYRDADYSTLDEAGVCHPERNHFMGHNTIKQGAKGARCGFPTLFTAGSYGKSAADEELTPRQGKLFFPARYGYASEVLIACWAYRNYVLHPIPEKVSSIPVIEFAGPSREGSKLAGRVKVAITGFDWRGRGIREVTLGIDTPDGAGLPMALASQRGTEHGQEGRFELEIDTTNYPSGYHDLAVRAVNEAGVQTWLSLPVLFVNPPPPQCVRLEGCVDGADAITIADHRLTIAHHGGELLGRHADCALLKGLTGQSLGMSQTGGFFLDGQPHRLPTPSQGGVSVGRVQVLRHASKVAGRGTVVAKGNTVTLDDPAGGASRYIVDLCE